jgi:methyl-accepting chemotaxis protein
LASPNSYSLLGEDEEPSAANDDLPPSGSSDPRATAHGWDSFVNSLNATAKGELGAVDEILISYANFAGGEFRAFDVESAKVMGRITAMEEAMEHDHGAVVQTRGSLTKLEEIVLANANGISDLMAILRENVSTVANLQQTVDETSTQVKTMSDALREVTETATNAF